jgi:uncharacterized protein (DUF885 family)
MPVRFLLEKVPGQCLGVIAADPFLLPTKKFPSGISAEDQRRLTKAIAETVVNEVLPSYVAFSNFIAEEYAPYGRTTLAVTALSGGEQRYLNDIRSRTTLSKLTPDQIHQIGLHEIERIEADMLAIAHHEGFADLAAFRESLKTNPKYQPTSSEQIVDDFRKYIAQMQPKLPELFGFIPGSPVTVEPMPDFEPGNATHYQTGTPDGKRPGRVVVATANFTLRSLIDDEATAYHEGIPGHHMQLSVAQKLPDLPKFRRHGGNSGYVEGWALYSEQLAQEMGFYADDPAGELGYIHDALLRSGRLVTDTGIHAMRWSREKAVETLSGIEGDPPAYAGQEIERYAVHPGQACSYMVGKITLLRLREKAKTALGPRFDIRQFHDAVLLAGSMPLTVLENAVDNYIAVRKA